MVVPFSSQARHPLGNEYMLTQIEAEGTLECSSDGRLVVVEVAIRLHAWLDVSEEVHEWSQAELSDTCLGSREIQGLFEAPALVTFPLRQISRFSLAP